MPPAENAFAMTKGLFGVRASFGPNLQLDAEVENFLLERYSAHAR